MNANELADLLEQDIEEGFGLGFLKDAVTMLRQQQAEIEALKAKPLTDDEVKEYYESTHETYAQYEGFVEGVKWASKITKVLNVPVKTLENEEFIKLAEESGFMLVSSHPQDMENALYECFPDQINYFARAILRKAQER